MKLIRQTSTDLSKITSRFKLNAYVDEKAIFHYIEFHFDNFVLYVRRITGDGVDSNNQLGYIITETTIHKPPHFSNVYFDETSNNVHYNLLLKIIYNELNVDSFLNLYNELTDNQKYDKVCYILEPNEDSILYKFDWNKYANVENFDFPHFERYFYYYLITMSIFILTSFLFIKDLPLSILLGFITTMLYSIFYEIVKYLDKKKFIKELKWFSSKDDYDFNRNKLNI